MDLKWNKYAKVSQRLKEFREDCPRANIITEPTIQPDGTVLFKCHIIKDKSDENSAESTGHALSSEATGNKVFEKTETIALWRALANMGYLASGEIASAEEMEDYMQYLDNRIEAEVAEINATETMEELQELWGRLRQKSKKPVIEAKDAKKLSFNK